MTTASFFRLLLRHAAHKNHQQQQHADVVTSIAAIAMPAIAPSESFSDPDASLAAAPSTATKPVAFIALILSVLLLLPKISAGKTIGALRDALEMAESLAEADRLGNIDCVADAVAI